MGSGRIRSGKRINERRYLNREFFQQRFVPEDQTIPFRLVGTYEYSRAIGSLSRLVQLSNSGEVAVYDSILAKQPEFSFLGSSIEAAMAQAANSPEQRDQQRLRRSGLVWMLALARIEVAATVAMYGGGSNAFDFAAPQEFGVPEYYQLMISDAKAHLHALQTDPLMKKVKQSSRSASSATIAYLRRLKVVDEMLLSISALESDSVHELVDEYRPLVRRIRRQLSRKVERATVQASSSEVTTEREVHEGQQRRDFQRGTVRAVSPIRLFCQRMFLQFYGAGP